MIFNTPLKKKKKKKKIFFFKNFPKNLKFLKNYLIFFKIFN